MLEGLWLGRFAEMSWRARTVLKFFLRARLPLSLVLMAASAGGAAARTRRYDFVVRYAYWRGIHRSVDRETWRRLTSGVRILVYHAFATDGEEASRFVVTSKRFARQLAWLRTRRYHVCGLDDVLRDRLEHRLSPARTVAITIDDGYRDILSVAQPLLRRHGFPATVFVVTGLVGGSNDWDANGLLHRRPLLSWDELRRLRREGTTCGAHTRTHPSLISADDETLRREIAGSRSDLERELVDVVPAFAYPYGLRDARATAAVRDASFAAACTASAGLNSPATPRLALRRLEVRGTDTLLRFAIHLWLGKPLRRV
jgi:peptidoglycan/xylan/chitin deacetylase (PgdA/CDA1 family)